MCKFRQYDNYEVFDDGKIYSYKSKKFLKPSTNKGGYQQVNLYDNEGKMKTYRLNRVVYEAVSGSHIPDGLQVNHINECKSDNRFENLNLMTCKENINFGSRNARVSKVMTNNPKLSKQVGAFDKNGELVMTFPSTMEASRQGFHKGNVSACCIGERKTHKGFTWRYI